VVVLGLVGQEGKVVEWWEMTQHEEKAQRKWKRRKGEYLSFASTF
jgi:hypothetical protein